MSDAHAQRELGVFRSFVRIARLPVDPASIRKRCPPRPDVCCELIGRGTVAFELVEIIDRSMARTLGSAESFLRELRQRYSSHPRRRSLASRLSNALVHVEIDPRSSNRARVNAIPSILSVLEQLPRTYEGTLPADRSRPAVREIHISRGGFSGPCFDTNRVCALDDPITVRLEDKLSHRYESDSPMELLAYYDLQPVLPDVGPFTRAQAMLHRSLRSSQFRRAWIVDLHGRRVRFVFPSLGR